MARPHFTRAALAIRADILAVVVCLCVCACEYLSVTRRYCIKRLNVGSHIQRHVIGQDSSFLTPTVVIGPPPISLNFAHKVTHPLRTPQFRPISAHSASTVKAGEKVSINFEVDHTRFPTMSHA